MNVLYPVTRPRIAKGIKQIVRPCRILLHLRCYRVGGSWALGQQAAPMIEVDIIIIYSLNELEDDRNVQVALEWSINNS